MRFCDYQHNAVRTADHRTEGVAIGQERGALAHAYAALGVNTEAGELSGAIKKMLFQGRSWADTRPLVKDEIGDVLWYLSWIAYLFDLNLEYCAGANIEKLNKRYPDTFTPDGGIRDASNPRT